MSALQKPKPNEAKVTIRVTPTTAREFKAACGRRGLTINAGAIEALREWTQPPLPANDNPCECPEASPSGMVVVFAACAFSGALIGGLGVYLYLAMVA